jgi:hypothetical protein
MDPHRIATLTAAAVFRKLMRIATAPLTAFSL